MDRLQKILLSVFFVCANSAFGTTPEDLREALKPEVIEKFSNVDCYLLENEGDIKQCAQVKAFTAQALAAEEPSKGKAYAAAALTMAVGGMVFLAIPKGTGAIDKIAMTAFLTPIFAMLAYKAANKHAKSSHVAQANKFEAYFKNLEQNPIVIDRKFAAYQREAMNKKGDIEAAFSKRCADHEILEKSPLFAQYRVTRIVPEVPITAVPEIVVITTTEISEEDPRPRGFPGDEDSDSE